MPFHPLKYPIIVIGAGAGGLVVAIGAAKAKKKVLLIEKGSYGGDCTNFGCIPSKSLIAAAQAAYYVRKSGNWGILKTLSELDTHGALERSQNIVREIRETENPQALAKQGIETLTGIASFIDPHTIEVKLSTGEIKTVRGTHIVIATGSYPYIPEIKGLRTELYATNETVFNLKQIPKRLGVIGGGPVGSELSQAFQRLGSQVTLVHHNPHILNKEEEETQVTIEKVFRNEEIILKTNYEPLEVKAQDDMISLAIKNKTTNSVETIEVDHLLISCGRRANIDSLKLRDIGVESDLKGVIVDAYGRTRLKHIWAVGDVVGRAHFTHVAENEARAVLTTLLLPWPFGRKLDIRQPVPRITFTDPEIASVGLSEMEAIKHFGKQKIATYKVPFVELDRAITTGRTEGFVKIITKKWSSKILGATIVAPSAGEMLSELTTAMMAKVPLRKLATLIHPYPSYSLAVRKAADQWLTKTILPSLFKILGR